ncbi:uncharacterized protein UV8b_01121 [Ustilaginoidea virens]|uniref:Uncharacterized protein n=1 Tax=Ustilaginoidea virens TaxID=1159556 RepID=A0A8E5HK25_USTVR|nr:uncharacterized protein UV8b_01121 [Ustilaginoidea virens]QUC16880.1 hypothetical protein UV8b_01121 [Ustilaginoidea virens]
MRSAFALALALGASASPATTSTPAPPTPTPTAPKECAVTNTQTWYGGQCDGCRYEPDPNACVADDILTLPCGCTRATDVEAVTTTVCAATPGAHNCRTGYMYTTTRPGC